MALKRFVHDPINDFAPLLCDHHAHDPRSRHASTVYLTEHDGVACAECLAHDRGEALEEWAAHEERCGSPPLYCLSDAEKDLASDLGVTELPSDLTKILKTYERKA